MPTYRLLLACFSVWLLLGSPANAGAPALDETCQLRGAKVPTQYNVSQKYFAEAGPLRSSMQRTDRVYVIYINPERTFLGRQTQQWLYLRQCAHIVAGHRVISAGERGLTIQDEEAADCWAAREISQGGSASKTLYGIESDMERLVRDGRWSEVLPGPERRISLVSCGK
jgi:hypothetical protein